MTVGHVLYDNKRNKGKVGDSIVVIYKQLGKYVSSKIGFISHLNYRIFRGNPKNPPLTLDIALITPILPVSYDIPGIGIPTGHVEPRNGMRVKHLGNATAKIQRGTVKTNRYGGALRCSDSSDGTTTCLAARDVFDVFWDKGYFSIVGDSGSFIVEEGTNKVVGIHKGGGETTSMCVKASSIARALGVSFVGSPGVFGGTTTATTTPTPTPIPVPVTQPQDPIASLIQAIIDFINSLLGK